MNRLTYRGNKSTYSYALWCLEIFIGPEAYLSEVRKPDVASRRRKIGGRGRFFTLRMLLP